MDRGDAENPEDLRGLSEMEAAGLLAREGYNEIPAARRRSVLLMAREVVSEPMFILLLACGGLYLFVGEIEDAAVLLSFVFIIMGITIFQERKTERAVEALRDLSSPRALVVRDGMQKRIPGREAVRGDIVILREGDRVPADGTLLSSVNIVVDESLLTGESVPVRKMAGRAAQERGMPGGEDQPFVYSGTLVVRGQGMARITATGPATEMGKIGKTIAALEPETTPLREETHKAVRVLALAGMALCGAITVLYALNTGDWTNSLLAGLALAMSILPEEIPVILTIFLALGAWRMAQKRVLTRRAHAVETLGAATVLCVDKTGTITQNRMAVRMLDVEGDLFDIETGAGEGLPEKYHRLVEYCILAGKKDPFDPMEAAISVFGSGQLEGSEHIHPPQRTLLREYPLSRKFLALTHVWSVPGKSVALVASKGAPEAIADLCHLTPDERRRIDARVARMARDGYRVLAVASGYLESGNMPAEQHDFELEFAGLVGFSDPVREDVPAAVKECHAAGIRVVMITGDYPETAKSVARAIGLPEPESCITGPELELMSASELSRRIARAGVFARVVPEQKLRIVRALQEAGEVVAMTGDGVNDAPALKAAHIGVAMGGRGTDVARESAAMVLTDDDFTSIVAAVRMGRRIYDNIKKAVAYTLAVHVPVAGMASVAAIFGLPLVFLPVHIVFLEMVIDPACSVVFEREPEETGIMARPPRGMGERIFNKGMAVASLTMGLAVFAAVALVFWWSRRSGWGMDESRALSFITLIILNAALIIANRSPESAFSGALKRSNASLWWLIGGTAVFLALVFTVPALRGIFRFALPHPAGLLLAAAAAVSGVAALELVKILRRRFAA